MNVVVAVAVPKITRSRREVLVAVVTTGAAADALPFVSYDARHTRPPAGSHFGTKAVAGCVLGR